MTYHRPVTSRRLVREGKEEGVLMPIPVRHLTLVLVFGLISARALDAQPQRLRFERLSVSDGLPGLVATMLQDRQGFLWIATNNGLARYDGLDFTVYRPDPLDSLSLSYRIVTALYEDRHRDIWIGMLDGSLDRLDPATGRIDHFRLERTDPPLIFRMVEDGTGMLWIVRGDGSLDRLDPATGASAHFGFESDASGTLRAPAVVPPASSRTFDAIPISSAASSVLVDRRGTLWVGTRGGGLHYYDASEEAFAVLRHDAGDAPSPSSDTISVVYEAPSEPGVLWIGTQGSGLHRLEARTGRARHFGHNEADRSSLSSDEVGAILEDGSGRLWVATDDFHLNLMTPEAREGRRSMGAFTTYPLPERERDRAVFDVLEDQTGALWISAAPGLLYAFEPESGTGVRYGSRLPMGATWPPLLMEDRTGILWVGSNDLFKLDRWAQQVQSYAYDPDGRNGLIAPDVESFYEDPDGILWITAGSGLHRLHRPNGEFSVSTLPTSNACRSMVGDPAGGLWCSSLEGLLRIDPLTGRTQVYRQDPQDSTSLSSDNVLAVYRDHEGTLWVGTDVVLGRFDEETETFVHYRHDPDRTGSLPSTVVNTIIEDRMGTLWVESRGTDAEVAQRYLSRFDRADRRFTSYRLPEGTNEPIYTVDHTGALWIPTNQGLYRHDPARDTVEVVFTEADGLPDNGVLGVLEDGEGRLWISTRNGLCRFDPTTRAFRNYDIHDGLPSNRFYSAAYRLSSGEMAFGTNNGFVVIDPSQDVPPPQPPAVHVTGLRLFNEPVVPGTGGPLQVPIDEADEVRLRHDQNDVTIEYVGLHFSRPERIRYRYRLAGYEANWRDAARERRAVYPNLPPGDYVFQVTAANADGVWNEDGASVAITVLPPWWQTWWAYSIYGLLLILGVVAVDRFQRRRLIRRERERAEREAEKLRAEAAEAWANYLQSENQRQTQELEAARTLQLSMLPDKLPEHPRVDIAASMQTATEVGGDYYDVDVSDDGTLTLAVGDATGHGTKAGTMVTAMKSLWNAFAREDDLASVLHTCSQALKRMGMPRLYMALALVRLRDQNLELAGAGLPPALIYRAAAGEVETVPLKGMPLGGPTGARYRTRCVKLAPGDTVVLMTDGFPELFNEEGEMLGYERVKEIFAEVGARSPEAILSHFDDVGRSWRNDRPVSDDVTFVVMRVKAGVEGGEEAPA